MVSTLWNAFKRIVAGASAARNQELFFGTAVRTYPLDVARPPDAA